MHNIDHNIDMAYEFYCKHICDIEKIRLLDYYGLKVSGFVPSVLWELFGAMLTGRKGRGGVGADLDGWEIKSAKKRGSYEYQYHLNTGMHKLEEDCVVNHLFCSYSENYENVTVKCMSGPSLAEQYFNTWMPDYLRNYDRQIDAAHRRQRFRKSIPFGYVENNGELLLEIVNKNIAYRDDNVVAKLNLRNR